MYSSHIIKKVNIHILAILIIITRFEVGASAIVSFSSLCYIGLCKFHYFGFLVIWFQLYPLCWSDDFYFSTSRIGFYNLLGTINQSERPKLPWIHLNKKIYIYIKTYVQEPISSVCANIKAVHFAVLVFLDKTKIWSDAQAGKIFKSQLICQPCCFCNWDRVYNSTLL